VEEAECRAEAALEEADLGAELVADAFLGIVDVAVGVGAVGLKGARDVGEGTDLGREFVEDARAGHGGVALVAAAVAVYAVVAGGFDRFVAQADRADEFLRKVNLVLEVERVAFLASDAVAKAGVGRRWLPVVFCWVEDIDAVGVTGAGRRVDHVGAVVFVFCADEDLVLPAEEGELSVDFGVLVQVLPLEIAHAVEAADDRRRGGERLAGFGRRAGEVAVVELPGDSQYPVFG